MFINRFAGKIVKRVWLNLDDKESDFPFYKEGIPTYNWIFPISGCLSALLLIYIDLPISPVLKIAVRATLLVVLPFLGLHFVSSHIYTSLCRKLRRSDFKLIVLTVLSAIVIQLFLHFLLTELFQYKFAENGGVNIISTLGTTDRIIYSFFLFGFQLMGEEMLRVLPFLFFLQFFTQNLDMRRKHSILFSWFISAGIFALLHLPTYDWNMIQVLVLFTGSFVMNYAYVRTKNVWVVYLVHLLYDFLLMIPVLFS